MKIPVLINRGGGSTDDDDAATRERVGDALTRTISAKRIGECPPTKA
jgi:hypothetical protein